MGSQKFITVGVIADMASVPLYRVEYYIRSRRIKPIGRVAGACIYDRETAQEIVDGVKGMSRKAKSEAIAVAVGRSVSCT